MSMLFQRASPLIRENLVFGGQRIQKVSGEFWTSAQRQASSLHEVSYRACFKPQLPAYFIKRLSKIGDTVYDPFCGRGTTLIEAALNGRKIIGNDINPLSRVFCIPRLWVPTIEEVKKRLSEIRFEAGSKASIDLRMFFHRKTESEIVSLRNYLIRRRKSGVEDAIDRWIRMVATNRLTGHSTGFFSVYTLPPNQAVSADRQRLINKKLDQKPEYRDVRSLIIKKTVSLTRNLSVVQVSRLQDAGKTAVVLNRDAKSTPEIGSNSIALTIFSPHFLDVVNYAEDNWLRCWFNDIRPKRLVKTIRESSNVMRWQQQMRRVFVELHRITRHSGYVVVEVGEVRNARVKLDELIIPLGLDSGFTCEYVLINTQKFTKTSNIWGISNNKSGTNSNRIVVFRK